MFRKLLVVLIPVLAAATAVGLYWKFQPLPETDVAERKRSLQGHPEKAALPPGRVMRLRPWCSATRLQAVLQAEDYHTLTTAAARPPWWRRLCRRAMR